MHFAAFAGFSSRARNHRRAPNFAGVPLAVAVRFRRPIACDRNVPSIPVAPGGSNRTSSACRGRPPSRQESGAGCGEQVDQIGVHSRCHEIFMTHLGWLCDAFCSVRRIFVSRAQSSPRAQFRRRPFGRCRSFPASDCLRPERSVNSRCPRGFEPDELSLQGEAALSPGKWSRVHAARGVRQGGHAKCSHSC